MENGRVRTKDFACGSDPVREAGSRVAETFRSLRKKPVIAAQFSAVFFVAFLALIARPVFGQTMAAGATGAMRYVSAQGSNSKDGLRWGTAKSSIAAGIGSCPTSGACTVNVSSLTLSAPLSVKRPETTIQCTVGATISTSVANGTPITLLANGSRITDCTFEYLSGVATTVVLIPHSVNHVTIDHNVFRDYRGRPSYFGIVRVGNRSNRTAETADTDVLITDNQFRNIDPVAINLQDDAFRVTVSNNVVVTDISRSNSPTINAQASDLGSAPESLTITNNSISKGTSNNCIQVQNLVFRNSIIRNVTVSRNLCRLQPNAGAGDGATGYSMVGIVGLQETSNAFEGNGQEISGNAPFEIVSCQHATSSGNAARMGTVSRNVNAFTVIGTRFAPTNGVSLTRNSVFMTVRAAKQATCYHVSAGQNARIQQINLSGNSCNLSGSTASGTLRGIWFQSYGQGAIIRGGTVSDNVIVGAKGAEVVGVHFERDAGAISGLQVMRNRFTNTRRAVVGAVGMGPG